MTHCGGSAFEERSAWFYVAVGSALFVDVGKTIAFEDHGDAVTHFLGRPCGDWGQCDDEIRGALPAAAEAAGYDSIQFMRHCDLCKSNGGCAHELMLTKARNGHKACPDHVEWRTGPAARDHCTCIASSAFQSVRGHGCAVCERLGL